MDLRCKEKILSDAETDLESENEVFEQNSGNNGANTIKFVLGPTPAQQKRSTATMSPDEMDKILETVNFREKFSSLPEFKPGNSPNVVVTSPKVFIQSYNRYVYSTQNLNNAFFPKLQNFVKLILDIFTGKGRERFLHQQMV